MKTNQILQLILICIIFPLSACSVSHTHDGTYEGILPAADCPGIYIMLTIMETNTNCWKSILHGLKHLLLMEISNNKDKRFIWTIKWNLHVIPITCHIKI